MSGGGSVKDHGEHSRSLASISTRTAVQPRLRTVTFLLEAVTKKSCFLAGLYHEVPRMFGHGDLSSRSVSPFSLCSVNTLFHFRFKCLKTNFPERAVVCRTPSDFRQRFAVLRQIREENCADDATIDNLGQGRNDGQFWNEQGSAF